MSFYTSATCGTVDAVIDDDFPGPSWTSSLEEIMARDVDDKNRSWCSCTRMMVGSEARIQIQRRKP